MAKHIIPVGGVSISCEDRGAGVPVVLVHGFPLDHRMWDAQIESLGSDFRVIAPDLRGFGGSTLEEADVEEGVAMDRYAADIVAALNGLGVNEPVVFVGLSMGGYVAWQFVRANPQRIRGLVLCDTRAMGDTEEAIGNRLKMASEVLDSSSAEPALAMLPKLLSPQTLEQRPEIVATVRDMIMRQSPQAIAAAQRGMARREDVRDELKNILCPCLAIVGQADAISPPKEMREIVAALPDARLEEIAGGHMTPVENAEAVTEAIREFASSRSGEV